MLKPIKDMGRPIPSLYAHFSILGMPHVKGRVDDFIQEWIHTPAEWVDSKGLEVLNYTHILVLYSEIKDQVLVLMTTEDCAKEVQVGMCLPSCFNKAGKETFGVLLKTDNPETVCRFFDDVSVGWGLHDVK